MPCRPLAVSSPAASLLTPALTMYAPVMSRGGRWLSVRLPSPHPLLACSSSMRAILGPPIGTTGVLVHVRAVEHRELPVGLAGHEQEPGARSGVADRQLGPGTQHDQLGRPGPAAVGPKG